MRFLDKLKVASIIIIWTGLTIVLTHTIVSHRIQADAIRHNAGEWTVDADGWMTFKWKGNHSVGNAK